MNRKVSIMKSMVVAVALMAGVSGLASAGDHSACVDRWNRHRAERSQVSLERRNVIDCRERKRLWNDLPDAERTRRCARSAEAQAELRRYRNQRCDSLGDRCAACYFSCT